jgi:hypothetical protein
MLLLLCNLDVEGQLTFTRKPEKNNVAVINMQDSTTKASVYGMVYMWYGNMV